MNTVILTGKVTRIEMSTFQYGSHMIETKDKSYALSTTEVQLKDYENKFVTIKGEKVKGYPLEGGPELIRVSEVLIK